MALSRVYRVVTRYETDSSRAESRLTRLQNKTDRLTERTERLQSRFRGLFSFLGRAATGSAALGLGLMARRALTLNKELENTKVSIASAFQLQGLGSFETNMSRATGLMEQFRKAAITSPGESRDLASIVRTTAPALAQVAPSDKEIVQFATRGLGAAFSQMDGNVRLTQDQLLQMMQGRGGSDLALFNVLKNPLAEQLGVTGAADMTKAINDVAKKDPRKYFEALNRSLADLDDANKAFAMTFTGLWASIEEVFNNTLLTGAQPLFDYLKSEMQTLLKWAEDNHAEIEEFARTIGEKLTRGFKLAAGAVKLVANNLEGVAALLSVIIARKAGLALAGAMGPGGMWGGARGFVGRNVASGMAVGSRVGSSLRGGARGALGFAGDAVSELLFGFLGGPAVGRGGRMVQGIRNAPGRLKAAGMRQVLGQGITFDTLGAGAKKLSGVAGGAAMAGGKGFLAALATGMSGLLTVLLPLTIVIAMVAGTFRVLKDDANVATTFLKTSWEELMATLDLVAAQFGQGGGFVQAVKDFVDWLGTGVVGVFGLVVKGVERVVAAFSFMIAVFKGFAMGIGNAVKAIQQNPLSGFKQLPQLIGAGIESELEKRNDLQRQVLVERAKRKAEEEAREEKRKKDKENMRRPPVNVTVIQQIETDANPDRIAFKTRDILEKSLFRNRRSASLLTGG